MTEHLLNQTQSTFEDSLHLERTGDSHWSIKTSPVYWNLIGPFGGWIVAAGLHAIQSDDRAKGTVVEAHTRFMAACKPGLLDIHVQCISQGRSLGFWRATLSQDDERGNRTCAEISVLLATDRETIDLTPHQMPAVVQPEHLQNTRMTNAAVRWLGQFHFRYLSGLPFTQDPLDADRDKLRSIVWATHAREGPLTWLQLAALADAPVPRVYLQQEKPSPISTVSMTLYFHVTEQELARTKSPWVLLEIDGHTARRGYFDHHARLWSQEGHLLCSSTQLAWFA
jgi:acyl-CoA thioesterase